MEAVNNKIWTWTKTCFSQEHCLFCLDLQKFSISRKNLKFFLPHNIYKWGY